MSATAEATLRILKAGPGVTLQDGGRHGYLRFGVTPAGPMDRLAFDTANRALCNAPGMTAIEVGLGGLEFTVETTPLTIAIAGGDFAITLDGRRIPPAVLLLLNVGAVVKIAAGAAGAWCYVALAGRVLVPPMLGSTATHARSGFGGLEGRPLANGDRLRIAEPRMPAAASGILEAPWLDRPSDVIRVILGPQDDYFGAEQVAAFLEGPWRLSGRGDRMAYFLEGPGLEHAQGFNIVSDGVAMGAIQVPGEGQPIVLMADRQPTGGYPKIATVIGPDLGRLAQARPGSTMRFQAVTVDEAVAARRAEMDRLDAGIAINPLLRTGFSSDFLLRQNLTDGILHPGKRVMTRDDRHDAGKLTAFERLEVLFDDGKFSVLEGQASLAPSAVLLAQGQVDGRLVYAASRDACVREGALTAAEMRGVAALLERAATERAPAVLLFDGLTVTQASDAETLQAIAGLQAAFRPAGVPRIAVVLGPCLGPDALLAALADFAVLSADQGFIASSGPTVVRALTNEILTGEEIGGPAIHTAANGLVHLAPNDVAALLHARRLLDVLPDYGAGALPCADDAAREEPSLDSLVPRAPTETYDVRDLLVAITDVGEFLEITPDCAGNLVTGFARFGGRSVGILANQSRILAGVLDAAAFAKAVRFVERCEALSLPLLTVVDCPGLLPGPAQERAGLLPHAAALVRTLAQATAPHVTLVIRNAIGPVASLMGIGHGTAYRWPSARIGLAGGQGGILPPEGVPPAFGTVIAPRQTRRWILAALTGADGQA